MYKAYLNNTQFFNTDINDTAFALTSAVLNYEAGKAGTFTFSLTPQNSQYDNFSNLSDYVEVYRDTDLIFSGRVYSVSKIFDNTMTVVCEGMLAVFNDTIFRPSTYNGLLSGLISQILTSHNDQVGSDKQINVGTISVTDETIYREFKNYESTLSRLEDLVDTFGGYLSIRKSSGSWYLDWTAEYTAEAEQDIDFGTNLIDVTRSNDASGIITVLIPLGAEIEQADGTKKRLTIADLQEQLGDDYIEDASAILEYGRIVGSYIWDDVTVAANLKSKGQAYLNEQSLSKTVINVSAVDLYYTDHTIEAFAIGEVVHVKSEIHDLDDDFTCLAQSINLLDPTQSNLTLGHTVTGYVNKAAKQQSKNTQIINIIKDDYATNKEVVDVDNRVTELNTTVQQNSTAIEQNATNIALKASQTEVNNLTGRVTQAESAIAQNANVIGIYFGEDGKISSWFTFEPNKFQIGKSDSPIHSEQDNQSYKFVDNTNNVLLEINPQGTVSQTVNVNAQIRYLDGDTPQWATRKGKYITNVGVNLNDLWIGG